MNYFRALIYSALSSLYTTYSVNADCDSTINYLVYRISDHDVYHGRYDLTLTIQCWGLDEANTENMVQTVLDKLNYQSFGDDHAIITCYLNTAGSVDQDDKTIHMWNLLFDVTAYLK